MKHTPTPWEVETVHNEGNYGDGGPDCRSGFDSFCIKDDSGRILFDTLNSDYRVGVVHEEYDEDDLRAWDEQGRVNAEFIVKSCNSIDSLVAALVAAHAHIHTANVQRSPSDDQIIADHIAEADRILSEALAKIA